jgi:hypothetical protein
MFPRKQLVKDWTRVSSDELLCLCRVTYTSDIFQLDDLDCQLSFPVRSTPQRPYLPLSKQQVVQRYQAQYAIVCEHIILTKGLNEPLE